MATNLLRNCSLVQRVEFSLSVFLNWALPTAFKFAVFFPSSVWWKWDYISLKLLTKNTIKNKQLFFFVLEISLYPVFTVFAPVIESSIWSVTLQEVSSFVFVCISVVCPLWKCSILLLKASLSSLATFCNQEEEFGKVILKFVILLTVWDAKLETEQCWGEGNGCHSKFSVV